MDIDKLLDARGIVVRILDSDNVDGAFIRRLMVKQNLSSYKLATILKVKRKTLCRWCHSNRPVKGSAAVLLALLDDDPTIADKIFTVSAGERIRDSLNEEAINALKEKLK